MHGGGLQPNLCLSRGTIAIHRKRMHKENRDIRFECIKCGLKFKTKNTMINNYKTSNGTAKKTLIKEPVKFGERTSSNPI